MPELAQVQVANSTLPLVEYQGQRVVTFAMVDQVHSRPVGTAKRNFRKNRDRFESGEDYFHVADSKGLDEIRPSGILAAAANEIMLLTETVYLMLVKSFTDDLAWEVQRQLVKVYFRAKKDSGQKTKSRVVTEKPMSMAAIHSTFKHLVKMQRDFCKDLQFPQALLAAAAVMRAEFGVEITRYIPALATNRASSDIQQAQDTVVAIDSIQETDIRLSPEATLTVSDLGALLGGYTGIAFNRLLYGLGYQVRHTIRGKSEWHPTEKGAPYAVKTFVPRTGGRGADVPQLLWKAKVLDALRVEPAVQKNFDPTKH
jgi:hypothetical protein